MKTRSFGISFLILFLLLCYNYYSQTIRTVGLGKTYSTITGAISAATNGDIIDIHGTITESGISVNKDLTIQGQGANSTIVQGHAVRGSADKNLFRIASNKTVFILALSLRHGNADDNVTNNTLGGAIDNNEGALTLRNCYIYDNITSGSSTGGAIFSYKGSLTAENCTFANNWTINHGGAIDCREGTIVNLTNCTITGNTCEGTGGGISIDDINTSVTIVNCTITGNQAQYGGGIELNDSDATLSIKNTILANNNATDDHTGDDLEDYAGTLTNAGNNLIEALYSGSIANGTNGCIIGDQTEANLSISSSLEDNSTTNGTPTLKLYSGSVAINAGADTGPEVDQRGAQRNGTTDIGAYEYWNDSGALPVELLSFIAEKFKDQILLKWETATEINNYGFEIERSIVISNEERNLEWQTIGLVEGHGNSSSPKQYEFIDTSPLIASTEYRLKQIDTDGSFTYYAHTVKVRGTLTVIDEEALPTEYSLEQNYPNPFNPTTIIEYSIPSSVISTGGRNLKDSSTDNAGVRNDNVNVTLKIYDLLGREVAVLVNKHQSAGRYKVEFNGSKLVSGMYIYKLIAGKFTAAKQLLLMK